MSDPISRLEFARDDRGAFLEDVAAALAALPVVGDGAVARAVREVQQWYWRPEPSRLVPGGRWAR